MLKKRFFSFNGKLVWSCRSSLCFWRRWFVKVRKWLYKSFCEEGFPFRKSNFFGSKSWCFDILNFKSNALRWDGWKVDLKIIHLLYIDSILNYLCKRRISLNIKGSWGEEKNYLYICLSLIYYCLSFWWIAFFPWSCFTFDASWNLY